MKELYVKMIDAIQDVYMDTAPGNCLREDAMEDSCYSRGDPIPCKDCNVLVLFTKLKEALAS
jgi:hypothetical protein